MFKQITTCALTVVMATISLNLFAGAAPAPAPAPAPVVTTNPGSENEDEVYLGLLWYFGGSYIPHIELGYRNVDVDRHGDVSGGAVSMSFYPGKGFDMLKLKGVKGDENLQGELGVGYSFQNGAFLGTLGAQGNHINAGLDYLFGQGPKVFGGINTIGDYDKSKNCPAGATYNSATELCEL